MIPHHLLGNLAWLAENPDDPTAPHVAAYVSDELREHVGRPDGYVPREVLVEAIRDMRDRINSGRPVYPGRACREVWFNDPEGAAELTKLLDGHPPAWFVLADRERMSTAEVRAALAWMDGFMRANDYTYNRIARYLEEAAQLRGTDLAGRIDEIRESLIRDLIRSMGIPPNYFGGTTGGATTGATWAGAGRSPRQDIEQAHERILRGANSPRYEVGPATDPAASEFVARVAEMIGAVGFCEVNGHRFEGERPVIGQMVVIGRLFSELPCVRCGRLLAACYDACTGDAVTSERRESP